MAQPVLGDLLGLRDHCRELGIARALAVRDTKGPGWNLLMRLYLDETNDQVRDGIAVAIAAASDDEVIDDVIALARDRRLGMSRLFFLRALKRSREPRARTALFELRSDPDLTKEIDVILRVRKRTRRRPTEHYLGGGVGFPDGSRSCARPEQLASLRAHARGTAA